MAVENSQWNNPNRVKETTMAVENSKVLIIVNKLGH